VGKKHKSNKRMLEKSRRREGKRKARRGRGTRRRENRPLFHAAVSDLPWSDWDPSTEGLVGLARRNECSPFAAVMLVQDLADDGEVDLPDGFWTPRRVEALSSEDILARLGGLGGAVDEPGFVRAA
jgi:hypothetical protein